jgi:hypothetical protein
MNEEIKWSKKEVVERPTQDRWGNDLPNDTFKVNVYRWKNYRLEKELYGENRLFYHIAKDNPLREELAVVAYLIGETPLYLCDELGSYTVCSYSNIKEATRTLQYILENGLLGRQEWVNPREEHVWGVLSYKPKRDVKTAV